VLRTKIVCTIGPASRSPEVLRDLIRAGMSVARLNFSHGELEEHEENIVRIREASEDMGRPVAILTDLQGPKLRVGQVESGGLVLREGQDVVLTTRSVLGHGAEIPVQYAGLPELVQPKDRILMDDGLLEIVVLATSQTDVRCRVVTGGMLHSNKGINLPRTPAGIPAITEKDEKDIKFALEHGVDWIALSFVRQASEVLRLKEMIQAQSPPGQFTPVIAKIEKPEAMRNIDAIIAAVDGIMVARGDLGIETSPEEVPLMQKLMIRKCNEAGVPVITATQMLESMIQNPRPTRAEASDVANAILDGTDAVMLSGETAVGKYPVQVVRMMARIAARIETEVQKRAPTLLKTVHASSIADAVSHAACETAQDLDAVAIVTPTTSGLTARRIARRRPHAAVIAVTPNLRVQRQLALVWGVEALLTQPTPTTDLMLADAIHKARQNHLVKAGDLIVMTAGAAGSPPGTTNLIKVQAVERALTRGQGVGGRGASGKVHFVRQPWPREGHKKGAQILVVERADEDFLPLAQGAAGLVVVEGDLSSHAAGLAQQLGIPAIVGVEDAATALQEGQLVTLDPANGWILEGEIRL
jgi:pyruvate kinase